VRGGKRPGAGRPKGPTAAYARLLKIVELVEQELARQLARNPHRRPNISRACQTIMKRGVARISARDWRALRSRYVDGCLQFRKHKRVIAVCVFDWGKKAIAPHRAQLRHLAQLAAPAAVRKSTAAHVAVGPLVTIFQLKLHFYGLT
jgi:hypothetical protein